MASEKDNKNKGSRKIAVAGIGGLLVIFLAIFAAYTYSKQAIQITTDSGKSNTLGVKTTQETGNQEQYSQEPLPPKIKADENALWKQFSGRYYPFTFSYPENITLVVFPEDKSDSVAIAYNQVPPQKSILLNVDIRSSRSPSFAGKPLFEFVKYWPEYYSGLKGVKDIERFTNVNGIKGYKARYINYADQTPNVDVFFEIPGESDVTVRMANGLLEDELFDKIVDSFEWTD